MTLTQTTETMIVTRDGHIDGEYYDELYSAKRQEALRAAGREVLQATLRAPIVAAHLLGIGIGKWLETID